MDLGLAGATALVQGGTQGMGRAAAECFAVDGAKVAVLARTQADLDATVARLLELGAPERAAIVLYHQEECSYEQISMVLGMPIGTVRTHLHRGREKLKQVLRNQLKMERRHGWAKTS